MKTLRALAAASLAALTQLAPVTARAQSSSDWRFQATVYGYFPDISATTALRNQGGGQNVTIDFGTILENLQFTLMGSFEVTRGHWGAFTDFIYMDLGKSKSGTREFELGGQDLPGNISANVDVDFSNTAWELAGTYRVVDRPGATVQLLGGARLFDVKASASWQLQGNLALIPPVDRAGEGEESMANWDAIVGAKGRFALGADRKWLLPWMLDVGTGESDLTWQAQAGIGYAFQSIDVFAAWRYVGYEFKDDSKIQDVGYSGPNVGLTIRW